MVNDPIRGFITKTIGFLPSEKVEGISFSGAGDIFNVFEKEGSKLSLSFYIISKEQAQPAAATAVGKGKNQGANKLVSSEEKYEFKKTAKHDVTESRYDSAWDISGRYLAIYGVKRSLLDKSDKSIKFYNILGEPLETFEKILNLQQFKWRPRPQVILKPKELQKL